MWVARVDVFAGRLSVAADFGWLPPRASQSLEVVVSVHFSSKTPEWATPQDLFDALNAELGPFFLDVCATAENTKCRWYFTKEQDGLAGNWWYHSRGRPIWMNPPYGRQIGKWVAKAARTATETGVRVVALLPARTDTKWWHDYIWDDLNHCPRPGVEVRLLKGRIKFGGHKNSAPFPSAVVVFG